ncbi:hypothetical protein SAY87_002673 [Trapa incisa]|uniref:MLO-like protein n=1 Tax=Trapa incisa TaxID=236973 RepID=A0AAN7JVE5_9MYRT|nr:hypothetical protein SAY87_002673 [Trapa incisa]
MSETSPPRYERTMEDTATWAVATVCFVLLIISLAAEHIIHLIEKWLKGKKKPTLVEALEKVKAELMLLGFISLLLTVLQDPISNICIKTSVAETWTPCGRPIDEKTYGKRRLLEFFDSGPEEEMPRRSLATKGMDKCTKKGKVAFMTAYSIHQLHVFIFVLAIFHVLYCIITLAFGKFKMRRWKAWDDETKTLEYKYTNDPERFRFARETSFGRRHLRSWANSSITLWIVCFFRQFIGSVTKVDYFALRHGFVVAHLTPEKEFSLDFQRYIHRTLEEDFKVVVGISPVIWFAVVLFLLANTHGWNSYLWLPFIPLIIILLVGTKLQVIITKMAVGIQERGDVVKGTPVVKPGDDLFWFGKPRFLLFLIHFVLFQNAFQLAFFAWSTYAFKKMNNCFHSKNADIIIRLSMGVVIQVFCSYVTLPLYALVTQMGSSMKSTIFDEQVATALKRWHHGAKKHAKDSKHSTSVTPFYSRPTTPEHGSSPVHLLHNYYHHSSDSLHDPPPRGTHYEPENWAVPAGSHTPSPRSHHGGDDDDSHLNRTTTVEGIMEVDAQDRRLDAREGSSHHSVHINGSNFSFGK